MKFSTANRQAFRIVSLLSNLLGIPALATCLYFASAANQEDSPPAGAKPERVVSALGLEIVDEEGRVCARIGSNEYGGLLELLRPGGDDKSEAFAWIGYSFQSGPEFALYESEGKARAGFYLGLTGEPVYPRFEMTALNGKPIMSVNGGFNQESTFTLWEPGQDRIKFRK